MFTESALCTGMGSIGLPSTDGDGEVTDGVAIAETGCDSEELAEWKDCVERACACKVSFRIFSTMSLLAFSSTGKFLNVNVPKSSAMTGSLRRRVLESRAICGGICSGINPRFAPPV